MTTGPILETQRLILRLPERTDFEAFAAMRADPQTVRYIATTPPTLEETWLRLLRYRGSWGIMGFGYWTAREKTSGRVVGLLGFGDFHRPVTPALHGLPEAGWTLERRCHGQGFATEGTAAMFNWLDTQTPHRVSRCLIDPENAASIRIAAKNGFTLLSETTFHNRPTLMFERFRPSAA